MHSFIYNPLVSSNNKETSKKPSTATVGTKNNIFPDFRPSFLNKNLGKHKFPICSFEIKNTNNNKNLNTSKLDYSNIEKEKGHPKINYSGFVHNNLPFSPLKKHEVKMSEYRKNPINNIYNSENQSQNNDVFSNKDLEKYPEFITKNTIFNEIETNKKIMQLKKIIRVKDFRLKLQTMQCSLKRAKAFLIDKKQMAKDAHYLVFNFEKDLEGFLLRKLRGKSIKEENLTKNPYKTFNKKHEKTISNLEKFYEEKNKKNNYSNIIENRKNSLKGHYI